MATLSTVSSSSKPEESFSTPNARGFRPSELFSNPMIESHFHAIPPFLRFFTKPFRLGNGASTVCSHRISRTSLRSSLFRTQVRPAALMSFSPLRFPSAEPLEEHFPLPTPSLSCLSRINEKRKVKLRVLLPAVWLFPLSRDADLSGLFNRRLPIFSNCTYRGLFFQLKGLSILRSSDHFSLRLSQPS